MLDKSAGENDVNDRDGDGDVCTGSCTHCVCVSDCGLDRDRKDNNNNKDGVLVVC